MTCRLRYCGSATMLGHQISVICSMQSLTLIQSMSTGLQINCVVQFEHPIPWLLQVLSGCMRLWPVMSGSSLICRHVFIVTYLSSRICRLLCLSSSLPREALSSATVDSADSSYLNPAFIHKRINLHMNKSYSCQMDVVAAQRRKSVAAAKYTPALYGKRGNLMTVIFLLWCPSATGSVS